MNSKAFDFPVSRLFGESDKEYSDRAHYYQSLSFKESQLIDQGYSLSAELDFTRNVRNVLHAYVVEAELLDKRWGLQETAYTQITIFDKRIEEIQTMKVNIWSEIKKIRKLLASVG
jgi:hypothetical protein